MPARGKTVLRTGATGGIGGAGLVLTGRGVDATRDPDKLRRMFVRQPGAWLTLAGCATQLSMVGTTMDEAERILLWRKPFGFS